MLKDQTSLLKTSRYYYYTKVGSLVIQGGGRAVIPGQHAQVIHVHVDVKMGVKQNKRNVYEELRLEVVFNSIDHIARVLQALATPEIENHGCIHKLDLFHRSQSPKLK